MELLIPVLGALACIVLALHFFGTYKRNMIKQRLRSRYGTLEEHDVRAEDIESIHTAYHYMKHSDDLDSITWSDLDLEEVYWQINSTQSTHGDEWLYARLHRQIPDDLEEIDRLIKYFADVEADRLDVQMELAMIGKHTGHNTYEFLDKIHEISIEKPLRFILQQILLVLGIILIFFVPGIGFPLLFAMVTFNFITYHQLNPNAKYEQNLRLIASSIGVCRKLKKTNSLSDSHPMFQTLNRLIPILSPIARRIKLSTASNNATENGMMFQSIDAIFLISPVYMGVTLKLVKKHKQDILDLFEVLGALDGAIAVASYKESLPYYCEPTFTNEDSVDYDALVHPLLAYTQGVSNTAKTPLKLLFTGSNASGKSTFIKALALNAHLGQVLNICTAKHYHYKPGYLYTSMALRDSVQAGKSYFIVELESLKRIVDAISTHDHCIIVVDEILRGTNTIERIAASSSILDSLKTSSSMICVATHDIELTQILNETFANYHFRETVTQNGISFDYKLHEGPSTTTNAIKLLDFMKFDREIVDASNTRVQHFKTYKSWN